MKAKDLHEKSVEDLKELEASLTRDLFKAKMKNFTNRLDDTSSLGKSRKEVARVKTVLQQKSLGITPVAAAKAGKPAKAGKKK
ncbi:MAG: 50S ribosomal protein L29 [Polyangiaceae bacterium]